MCGESPRLGSQRWRRVRISVGHVFYMYSDVCKHIFFYLIGVKSGFFRWTLGSFDKGPVFSQISQITEANRSFSIVPQKLWIFPRFSLEERKKFTCLLKNFNRNAQKKRFVSSVVRVFLCPSYSRPKKDKLPLETYQQQQIVRSVISNWGHAKKTHWVLNFLILKLTFLQKIEGPIFWLVAQSKHSYL